MLSTSLTGSGVYDESARFRMYFVATVGIFAFGSVLFWRSQLFYAADYVELPQHKVVTHSSRAPGDLNDTFN